MTSPTFELLVSLNEGCFAAYCILVLCAMWCEPKNYNILDTLSYIKMKIWCTLGNSK